MGGKSRRGCQKHRFGLESLCSLGSPQGCQLMLFKQKAGFLTRLGERVHAGGMLPSNNIRSLRA